jgi:hypothetical protein
MSRPSRLDLDILYLKALIANDEWELRRAQSGSATGQFETSRARLIRALLQDEGGRRSGYDPNQPRVPAGNPDGGQWTSSGGGSPVRLAVERTPRGFGSATLLAAAEGDARNNVIPVARKRVNEAECWAQYQRDIFHCRMVGNPACYAQAAERYSACLAGRPIPPLSY